MYQLGLWRPVSDALRVRPERKFDVVLPWNKEDCKKIARELGYLALNALDTRSPKNHKTLL